MRFSLLDQSPRTQRITPGEALRASVARAVLAEELGYERIWFAEHHSHSAFAGSSPLALAAAALQATSRIRVGTGGVLIAFNDPRQSADAFLTLAAMHPGRVDAGIGKANADQEHYRARLGQFLTHLKYAEEDPPPVWIMGTGARSALLAESIGAGYAYGHFFHPGGLADAFSAREARPIGDLVAARVIVGDDQSEVNTRAARFAAWRARRDYGRNEPLPAPGDYLDLDPALRARAARNLDALVHGEYAQVIRQLRDLAGTARATEVMVTLPEPDPERASTQMRDLIDAARTSAGMSATAH